jgi:hypothetical protein
MGAQKEMVKGPKTVQFSLKISSHQYYNYQSLRIRKRQEQHQMMISVYSDCSVIVIPYLKLYFNYMEHGLQ